VHAVNIHSYNIRIKLKHLLSRPLLNCSNTSSINSIDTSLELYRWLGTSTPASSVSSMTVNINLCLLELNKGTITELLLYYSKRL
jgi:hypothetical protein